MKGLPFEFEEWGAALHPPFGLLLAADPLVFVNGGFRLEGGGLRDLRV